METKNDANEDNFDDENMVNEYGKIGSPAFPVITVKFLAKKAFPNQKIGLTAKATHILSIASGLALQKLVKLTINDNFRLGDKINLTRAQFMDTCVKNQCFRFMCHRFKHGELNPYFGHSTELSRKILYNKAWSKQNTDIEWFASYPPGVSPDTTAPEIKERENFDNIVQTMVDSTRAYLSSIPTFLRK